MKRQLYLITVLILCGLFANSCELVDDKSVETDDLLKSALTTDTYADLPEYFIDQLKVFENVTLNAYDVKFMGLIHNKVGGVITSTTFNYRVSGTGQTPQLDSFNLEVPLCAGAPLSWNQTQSAKVEGGRIIWNKSISKDGSEDFSITFSGKIEIGIVQTEVVRASNGVRGTILGPCQGTYSISGNVYIDANSDKIKQDSESGIGNLPVALINNVNNQTIATVPTLSNGSYSLKVVQGDYTISSQIALLDNNYKPTTPTFLNLGIVNTNKSNIDFGYLVDSKKVTEELNEGIIQTNTEPTKFWVLVIRQAGNRNALYTNPQILTLLSAVENLLLPEPFNLGSDKKKGALEILTRPIRTDLDAFLQQLLTAELNILSGRGALKNGVLDDDFNTALLIYSEAIGCEALGVCKTAPAAAQQKQSTISISSFTRNDTDLLSAFNGTGGVGNQ